MCPTCGAGLPARRPLRDSSCPQCHRSFASELGILDFVSEREPGSERAYYDSFYGARMAKAPSSRHEVAELAGTWIGPNAPWEMRCVLEHLGDISGKTVLLLGNGESAAELFFDTRNPAALIYSDLSPVGLAGILQRFSTDESVVFTAIDALELPLRDNSVDVVYGFAFVHHLPDRERFFREVVRVLRPGGRAVFMDNAYSPVWQRLKLVWLRPLMRLSHRLEPRSPEDLRDTMAGGMREELLADEIQGAGGEPWFERIAFLYWYWKRVSVSLFAGVFRFLPRHDLISRALMTLDLWLARFSFVQRNMIRLVWGLEKPLTAPAAAPGENGAQAATFAELAAVRKSFEALRTCTR